MIETINQKIEIFISSLDGINDDLVNTITNKSSTAISENLKNGHLTTNVCMVAASLLKLNPKELAINLEKNLSELELYKAVKAAGPGFINITLHRKDFASVLHQIIEEKQNFGKSIRKTILNS